MKIRTGFVSNSSSSSFLIYGMSIADEFTEELKQKVLESKKGIEYKVTKDEMDAVDEYELREFIEYIVPAGFDVEGIEYSNEIYIGISPENQPNDMTHGDWKKMINDKLESLFGKGNTTGWFEDCSYDG